MRREVLLKSEPHARKEHQKEIYNNAMVFLGPAQVKPLILLCFPGMGHTVRAGAL